VDSVEGRGTSFSIKLPVLGTIPRGEEKTRLFIGERRKASILVIEDEEEVQELLNTILLRDEHEVVGVAESTQGIEILKKKNFDFVFTDLGMPVVSGWQIAEKLRVLIRECQLCSPPAGTGK